MENAENSDAKATRSVHPNADEESTASSTEVAGSVHGTGPDSEAAGGPTVTELQAQVDDLKKQLHNQTLRAAADLDNFRKRTRKDMDEAQRRVREDVLRELLPVFDNLERAVGAAKEAPDLDAIVQGIQMVLRLFEDVGQRFQLERVTALGQPFDPSIHEAIQQVATTEHPEGTVVSEFMPGYKLAGRLVRAAAVGVARKPAEPAAE